MDPASQEGGLAAMVENRSAASRGSVPILEFTLDGARYGIAAGAVQEVTRAVAIAALPKAPAIIEGIIDFHGALVPVLDIRQRFSRPAVPLHPNQHFIVACAGPRVVALRVDRVTDLNDVDEAAIESVSRAAPGSEYVRGVARLSDGLIIIHDLDSFLALDEGSAVDRALALASPGETAAHLPDVNP